MHWCISISLQVGKYMTKCSQTSIENVTKYILALLCRANSIFIRICYPTSKNNTMLQFHTSNIRLFPLLYQKSTSNQRKAGYNSKSSANSEQLKKSISITYPRDKKRQPYYKSMWVSKPWAKITLNLSLKAS